MKALNLLLVDDDDVDRLAARRLLTASDLQVSVVEASDAAAALDTVLAQRFDCVLLDFNLPRLDGLTVLRRMRALGVETPVVMLTGQGDEALAVELMKAGASDYLPKAQLSAERLSTAILAALKLHEAQQAAKQAQELLRQQVQFAEMFVGIASHDLRNPLSVIMLSTALLERSGTLPENMMPAVARIKTSGKRALRLIRDLLDFTQARLGTGLPVTAVPADLQAIANEALEELRSAHPGRDIVLEAAHEASGVWDPDRLAQLIGNLVTNALVYGDTGRPVTVHLAGDADAVRLTVHNWGDAIPAELMGELFQPLRQGPGQRGAPMGNIGLGLFIVQQIALAHSGTVDVESSFAGGTTFIVRLPRTPA